MTPTVARIVHFMSQGSADGKYPSVPRAAIITEVTHKDAAEAFGEVYEERLFNVSLCVLNPTGQHFNQNVPYSPEPKPGHWSWPPQV